MLPSDETTFNVQIKGETTGRMYEGSFTYKLPDLREESDISKMKARLDEGLSLDEDMNLLHDILSYLYYTIKKAPEWWTKELSQLKTRDYNVYTTLRKKCLDFEREWTNKVWGDEEKSEKDNTGS